MPCLKKDASPALVDAIQHIESRADECSVRLALPKIHSNIALWALLVGGIKLVEQGIAAYGDNSQDFDAALINISRIIPIAMKWVASSGNPASSLAQRRWTSTLAARTDEAFSVAGHYSTFLACFPMWHGNRYLAELISPALVRFTAPGSFRERQVSAHLKGFRPTAGPWESQRAKKTDQPPQIQERFASVLKNCRKTGSLRFRYDDPWDLWFELLPDYQARVTGITRRPDSLSLGSYTLGQFKRLYAGLLAVCATHEFLCFRWGQVSGGYPFDSAVMVRSTASWISVLSALSGLSPGDCQAALSDLTFDLARSSILHINPFVPLDGSTMNVALAPMFPLHSLPDENILRVCSQLRPSSFDATTVEKQSEMLATLGSRCGKFALQGSTALPSPHPDIDLIVTDDESSTIVLAEMKWIRKTMRPAEFRDKDAEILKGISQLEDIRDFLAAKPDYLPSLGRLPRQVSDYSNVYYLLVVRDHWLWVEPNDDVGIVEFDAFSSALARSEGLQSAVKDLLRYDWLPVEGRDFIVQYDRAMVNGVALESEVFYSPKP
jgi:hypothetical protein